MSVIGKAGGTESWLLTNEGRTDRRLMLPLFKTEVKIQRPRLPASLGGGLKEETKVLTGWSTGCRVTSRFNRGVSDIRAAGVTRGLAEA